MSHTEQFQHLRLQLGCIKAATNNFSDETCIGHGGFGKVYKGEVTLSKGETIVALKRLDRTFGQGDTEFWKEIMMLSLYSHRNIVSLLGYCDDDDEKILAYEYPSKKSLDAYLGSEDLTWAQRLKICVGAARGLAYLHAPAETQLRIVHRDIKSSNILLDNDWNAKISDFRLSKFAPANNQFTYVLTNPAGTHGYIDPVSCETMSLTKESDVYSFGVVLFEVLCGRLCFGNENLKTLVELVREYYSQNKIIELVFSNIKDQIQESSLKLFVDIAYRCLSRERKERPLMKQIVSALVKALNIQKKADVPRTGILNVNVLGTSDVISKNPFKACYFVLVLDRNGPFQNKKRTEWNEESTLYVEDVDRQSLCIYVHKIVSGKKHRLLGKTELKLVNITPEKPRTCNHNIRDDDGNYAGDINVGVFYKPTDVKDLISPILKAPIGTPKDGGLLIVMIHHAKLDFPFATGSSVLLRFRGKLSKTMSMMNTTCPLWLQEFRFMFEHPPMTEDLSFEIINNSWTRLIPGMGSFGCVNINLAGVVKNKCINKVYNLQQGDETTNNIVQVELHWRTSD